MRKNPFSLPTSLPGQGLITVSLLEPETAVLEKLSYQYPLKLIAPAPCTIRQIRNGHESQTLVHIVFLLTYGGGLVAGDSISLQINLAKSTRLVLLTQGSTKIFKSPTPTVVTRQHTNVDVGEHAALCYLPDPVQPFEASVFEQKQTYNVAHETANLCVCDWVCEGRTARGERWSFTRYASSNEFWLARDSTPRRLLLRDNVILDELSGGGAKDTIHSRMETLGIFGTLIICGPMFQSLAAYFIEEFQVMPRIGSRQWDALMDPSEQPPKERLRALRNAQEIKDKVLWTVAESRGFCLVKFGAREVEGAKRWLNAMLVAEGTVLAEFGERALLCLR